jgi:hypothetical protein
MKSYFLSIQSTKSISGVVNYFSGVIDIDNPKSPQENLTKATEIMVKEANKLKGINSKSEDYIVLSFNNVT